MNKPPSTPPRLVDETLENQRLRWRRGERVFVEVYLRQTPALHSDRNVLLDLIYNEIVLREQAGERPQQQEYVLRFPLLSAELALQFEVDRGLDWQRAAEFLSGDERRLHELGKGKLDCTALAEQLGITPEALREKLARAANRAAHDLGGPEK
jgi:hypothetical protein